MLYTLNLMPYIRQIYSVNSSEPSVNFNLFIGRGSWLNVDEKAISMKHNKTNAIKHDMPVV